MDLKRYLEELFQTLIGTVKRGCAFRCGQAHLGGFKPS